MSIATRTFYSLAALVSIAAWASAASAQVNIGANFQTANGGASGTDSGQIQPPDTMGAAGTNQIMILNNNRYKTFSKTGTQNQSSDDGVFFANAGYNGASGTILGDPRVLFDPLSGRWFALNFTNTSTNNSLVLAISANSDPSGTWKSVVIPTSGASGGSFADFPTMGIDRNGVYISTNNFIGNTFQNIHVFTLGKNELLWSGAGSPNTSTLTSLQNISSGTTGFAVQASVNFDVNQTGNVNRTIASFDDTRFRTVSINNTGGTTNISGAAFVNGTAGPSPPDAVQPGTSTLIATGDSRTGSNAVRIGNLMYWAIHFNSGGRSAIRWNVMDVTTNAIVQAGTISDPNLAFYYPSIAVNENGQAVIGFSGSSSTQNPSVYVAASTTAGSLNFGTPQLVATGGGAFIGSRWGDYSATTVDPADTGIFWTFQEISTAATNTWATRASEIIPTLAGQVRWRNAANGTFASGSNWFNGVAPGATDWAIYSRNGAPYTVTLPAGATTNDRISVRQDQLTLSIPVGATYSATNANVATPSFAVSEFLGTSNVTISGGGTFNTVNTTIAAGQNGLTTNNVSVGTVNLNGSTWNNTNDLHIGGSATRAGGLGTVFVTNGGVMTVGGNTRIWTNGSGIGLTAGAVGATFSTAGLRADSGVAAVISSSGTGAVLNITNGNGQNYFGSIGGTLSLNKSGAGTQTFSGGISYLGNTTVTGGSLVFNTGTTYVGTGAFNINGGNFVSNGTINVSSAGVNVNNGGTLKGNGAVNTAVVVSNGGTVAPGNSPGILSIGGGLVMNAGTYLWELGALTTSGAGTNFDQIAITGGNTTIGGTSQVTLDFTALGGADPNSTNAFWQSNHQWQIVAWNNVGTFSGIYSGISNANYSQGFFTLSGGNGPISLNFVFSPTPEPGVMVLLGAVLVAAALVSRMRRSSAKA